MNEVDVGSEFIAGFARRSQKELEGVIASLRELEDNTSFPEGVRGQNSFRMLLRLLSPDQLSASNSI